MRIFKFFRYLFLLLLFIGAGVLVVTNYSWIFAKRVKGKIVNVERVMDPSAILGSRLTPEQMHSYAILIEGQDGRMYAASSEDRKWQIVKKGYCVDALLYRYPPWDLDKANTFFNARLDDLSLCPGETRPPDEAPALPSKPAEPVPQLPPPTPGQ